MSLVLEHASCTDSQVNVYHFSMCVNLRWFFSFLLYFFLNFKSPTMHHHLSADFEWKLIMHSIRLEVNSHKKEISEKHSILKTESESFNLTAYSVSVYYVTIRFSRVFFYVYDSTVYTHTKTAHKQNSLFIRSKRFIFRFGDTDAKTTNHHLTWKRIAIESFSILSLTMAMYEHN